jgi:hypothetical protein
MEVLNAFQIPYLVVHDEDPVDQELKPGGSRHDPDKLSESMRAYGENNKIAQALDSAIGKIIQIPDTQEKLLNVSTSQVQKLGKPLAAVEKYSEESTAISSDLECLIKQIYE